MSRTDTTAPALPVVEGGWLRPAPGAGAEPRWGHPDGLQVGLHPLPGPRGLLRIFAPYLGHPRERLLNFIAIEPIPAGATERGYSELEHSVLDDADGKRFWSVDALDADAGTPRDPLSPARGVVETVDGVGTLTVHVDSSAHLYELRQLLLAGLQDQLLLACAGNGLKKITLKRGVADPSSMVREPD